MEKEMYFKLHVDENDLDIVIAKLKKANSLADELASKLNRNILVLNDEKFEFDSDNNLLLKDKDLNRIIFTNEEVKAIGLIIMQESLYK